MSERTFGFGPLLEEDGVRFRLWAPAVERAGVVVAPGTADEAVHAMTGVGDGWLEARVKGAGAGTLYQFEVGDLRVPDPASRYQPQDVMGPSEVVDLAALPFGTTGWSGRPWSEAVLYELHVGTFSPEGTYDGVIQRLDHLARTGITAIELMPLADFPGLRNWGYDGVLHYAPDASYGRPEDLARLIDVAHQKGLMVFVDVVYNHFGPEGNFLHAYAPGFFRDDITTPWGAAIDFRRQEVRRFFIENAAHWLENYRFDGIRFDAVHAIADDSDPDVLTELAAVVHARLDGERQVHLVLENDANEARRLRPRPGAERGPYDAQWNDDFHHVAHHLLTGERDGYYVDFADAPHAKLVRSLTSGFVFQGEPSPFRGGEVRGEPSADLPPRAFVNFLQNHDQVGNRAFGERLASLADQRRIDALTTIVLLAPSPPLLFMGEEWGATTPFLFFCDFHDALADAVREGRRREFAKFPAFADPAYRASIPDPNAAATFEGSKLDWASVETASGQRNLERTRDLLAIRVANVAPLVDGLVGASGSVEGRVVRVVWHDAEGAVLTLLANLGDQPAAAPPPDASTLLLGEGVDDRAMVQLAPWTTTWWRARGEG
ncbi:MAG: malto-oligosyltrehalose trehalohydrolase [Pseudomonadota bacterium]